jgi:hypothetical protein
MYGIWPAEIWILLASHYVIGVAIVARIAVLRNRNPCSWGLIGGWFPFLAAALLLCLRPQCPKCGSAISNDIWRKWACPCQAPVTAGQWGLS